MSTVYTLEQFAVGQDILPGTAGTDSLEGGSGTDIINGNSFDDTLRGAGGDDFLLGEEEDDQLIGEGGDDILISTDNTPGVSGYIGANFTGFANPGDPSLISAARDRQFQLDEWFDILRVPPTTLIGNDDLDGGAGAGDIAVLDLSTGFFNGLNFTLSANFSIVQLTFITTVVNCEVLWARGSSFTDQITGGALDDRIDGFFSNDVLNGAGGDDFLLGGQGQDRMDGGDGDDTIAGVDFFSEFERDTATQFLPSSYLTGLFAFQAGVNAGDQDNRITGGVGTDTAILSFQATGGVTYQLVQNLHNVTGLGLQMEGVEAIWAIDSNSADDITGGAGDDHFYSDDATGDTFDGGGGVNTYEVGSASVVNLANDALNNGGAAGETLTRIQNVIGSDDADSITGDDADNQLHGRGNFDTIAGGDGADTLDGGAQGDQLQGGAGTDTATYEFATARVVADLVNFAVANLGDAFGDSYTSIENLIGSRRGDDLFGDDNANRIEGGLGSDSLLGRGDADTFVAGGGSDTINGGSGSDTLVLTGDYLDYVITTVPGGFLITDASPNGVNRDGTEQVVQVENFIFADQTRTVGNLPNVGPESIALSGPQSVDENSPGGTIVGNLSAVDDDGDPITFSEVGDSTLFDVVNGQIRVAAGAVLNFENTAQQSITVRANDGQGGTLDVTFQIDINDLNEAPTNITLSDTSVEENSDGGTVVGDLSAVDPDGPGGLTFSLVGGGSSPFEIVGDELRVKAGADLDFEADPEIDVTIRVSDGLNTFDKTFTIDIDDVKEPIDGTKGPDDLAGTSAGDTIRGFGGADTLTGGKGADTLEGGKGNDVAAYTKSVLLNLSDASASTGQAKDDTFDSIESFQLSDGADSLLGGNGGDSVSGGDGEDDLKGGKGADTLSGGGDDDNVSGDAGNDSLSGGSGEDFVNGGAGKDSLSGGDGNDTVRAGEDNDRAFGGNGNDDMQGQQGNDFVSGDVGNDSLGGNIGNDTLEGGRGNDLMNADEGNDLLTGGPGRDIFVFDDEFGRDTIADFNGDDKIRFDSEAFSDFDDVIDNTVESGANLIIRLDKDNRVTLVNFDLEDLRANDFEFV